MADNMTNPWPSLGSYQDPETSNVKRKFCGRDNESFDVAQLIDDNIFTTLYGKSGTGKTSLLNAGVFPRLRQSGYLPVSIRLGMDAIGTSFQQCVFSSIEQALDGKGSIQTYDVVSMPDDEQSQEYLWSYFARSRFVNHEGQSIFPVIVFDQFEEVFRNRREDTEVLLRQIYFMMDEGHALSDRSIDGQPYSYDFNFRFVISIREDDLYRLEDSIDNNYLLEMKRCRFRLRNLSEEGARQAIFTPGGDLFLAEEREQIANTIIGIARNQEDHSISAHILSLICSRIFVEFQRSKAQHIHLSLVDKFVKGNPLEQFYNEATQGFSNKEKSYIETHMVDSAGRRNSIAESDFLLHVKNGAILFEGTNKILQRTSTSSDGGNYRIELIHDSFCAPLAGLKEKRERRQRMIWLGYAIAFVLLTILIAAYLINKNKELNRANEQLILYANEVKAQKDRATQVNERLEVSNNKLALAQDSIQQTKRQVELFNVKLKNFNANLEAKKSELEETIQKLNELQESFDIIQAKKETDAYAQVTTAAESKDTLMMNADGIELLYEQPTNEQLAEWAQKYHDKCSALIKDRIDGFNISKDMIDKHPCLVYLILQSKSLEEHSEKQNWFNMYYIMNESQLYKLYSILYKEIYNLEAISKKYAKKQENINRKYAEQYNNEAYEYASKGNFKKAIELIDQAIKDVPNEANYYDSKGEILLMSGDEKGAITMWKKVMELDPDFLNKHNGSTPLYKQLVERGLIQKTNNNT